jgi:hypothetical protein
MMQTMHAAFETPRHILLSALQAYMVGRCACQDTELGSFQLPQVR